MYQSFAFVRRCGLTLFNKVFYNFILKCLRRILPLQQLYFKLFIFHFYMIGLLFLMFGMSACRSHKKATAPASVEGVFYTSCYPIENLYVPSCKLEISDGGKSFSFNGSIYIRADSICFFRGKWLLFEIRGAIYRDSFVVVNYLERICYKGKNNYLQKITGYPVNPESLMMLFTADRCEEAYRNKFNFTAAGSTNHQLLMQGENRSLLEMNFNANDRTIENITLYNNQQRKALFRAVYGSYTQYPQFVLPTVFDISANDGEQNIRIKANFQQILFNQPQKVNMSVPSGYKIVVLGE